MIVNDSRSEPYDLCIKLEIKKLNSTDCCLFVLPILLLSYIICISTHGLQSFRFDIKA